MKYIIEQMISEALHQTNRNNKNHISFLGKVGKHNCGTIGRNSETSLHRSTIPLHAEMDCIKKLAYQMSKTRTRRCDVDLISIKVKQNGTLGNSQPCYHCATELYKHKKINVRHVYFSMENGMIQKCNFNDWYEETTHYVSSGWNKKLQERQNKNKNKKIKIRK